MHLNEENSPQDVLKGSQSSSEYQKSGSTSSAIPVYRAPDQIDARISSQYPFKNLEKSCKLAFELKSSQEKLKKLNVELSRGAQ